MKRIKLVPPLNEAVFLIFFLATLALCVALSMAVTIAVLAPVKYAMPYIETLSLGWYLFFIILLSCAFFGVFAYTLVQLYKVVCVYFLGWIVEHFFEVVESPLQESKAWNIGVIAGFWLFMGLTLFSMHRCGAASRPSCPPAGEKPATQQDASDAPGTAPGKMAAATGVGSCLRR